MFPRVALNTEHPDDAEPAYLGDSVAHWEGDTPIVDINRFNDKTWLIGGGTFHSDALHVIERYARVDKDQIYYEVVMEDPKVLIKPWIYRTTMMLREGTRVREYVCAENNLEVERYEKLRQDGIEFRRR